MLHNPMNAGGDTAFQEAMRRAFVESVTAEDIGEIARALVKKAKEGNVAAARMVLNLVIGPPADSKRTKTAEAVNHPNENVAERRGYVVPVEERATLPMGGGPTGPQVFTEPMPSRFARSEKSNNVWEAVGRLGQQVLQEIEEKKARDKSAAEQNVSANGDGDLNRPAQNSDAKL